MLKKGCAGHFWPPSAQIYSAPPLPLPGLGSWPSGLNPLTFFCLLTCSWMWPMRGQAGDPRVGQERVEPSVPGSSCSVTTFLPGASPPPIPVREPRLQTWRFQHTVLSRCPLRPWEVPASCSCQYRRASPQSRVFISCRCCSKLAQMSWLRTP